MQRHETFATLRDVFRRCFLDDGIEIDEGTTAVDIDGWDSLSHVRLMMLIEDTFGITISGQQASRLRNVGELVDLVIARTDGQGMVYE